MLSCRQQHLQKFGSETNFASRKNAVGDIFLGCAYAKLGFYLNLLHFTNSDRYTGRDHKYSFMLARSLGILSVIRLLFFENARCHLKLDWICALSFKFVVERADLFQRDRKSLLIKKVGNQNWNFKGGLP